MRSGTRPQRASATIDSPSWTPQFASSVFTPVCTAVALGATPWMLTFIAPPKTPTAPPFITYWLMRRSSGSVISSVGLMISSARSAGSISSPTLVARSS